ncbi:haloacid dehalogenase superfamily, subfamily IA, variant 3 with third motif having DD or ED/haloacid dehalogenase superfamily, subfamily IA, variant 1 with third motif having Dx(3-4)D or Dx(3-4)E [Asanoa hainanensis]|uniref:Haloacid dehalogenase superfamily, subfamily IA, variant 3 with third motif having DD or ED/haloacid dehalogenase superfamily, subfamily IA, variant 1 with third motif having Dx(3-4)D or Dx(3-4)E n=1 Tax=Asanoa hainanensis TaxID=560556 RepID=A0A239PF54_9ACTN|nr:haloacid dehalogenase superfamily, subfamily IA, variant 3 with third motif having DD or ED/haloacid dehalogenase superfamily, subfamily IA, variant 1 with third motif having Dx(3-4)D or Dx(3-4)E [Asanoa hainanensis]
MGPPVGVLFDVDGTLVDSTYLHAVTWWEGFRAGGHDVPIAQIHRAVGMGADRLLDHLLGVERDRSQDELVRAVHAERYAPYLSQLRPLPGAAKLLRACHERGQRVALASSATPEELTAMRRALSVDDVLDGATSSGDAQRTKPEPDIIEAALRLVGLSIAQAVYVGDSIWDIAACAKLGVPCVALTCGGTSRAELAGAGAVAVYEDPADLLTHLDDSPLTKA